MSRNHVLAFAAALALSACAGVDMTAERAELFAEVGTRAGAAPAEDAAIAARLDEPLDQADAVSIALARNRGLRADLAEAGLARAAWIEAGLPPNIAFHGSLIPESGEPDMIDLDFTAPVLGLLALPARRAEARDRYDAARSDAVLAVIDFAAETRIAWVEAVAARQRAELARSIRRAAEAALVAAEELRAAGNIPAVDVDRERALAQRARLDAENAGIAARAAEQRLRARLGLDPGDPLMLPDRLPEAGAAAIRDGAVDAALEASLPLAAARARAEAEAKAANLANVESLLDHAALGVMIEREEGEWAEGPVLEAEIPIFNWGRAERDAARIRADQALDRLAQMSLETRAAATVAAEEAALAAEQASYVRDEVLPTSEAVMRGVTRQYNAMQRGVFDLIAAFETRAAAGESYVAALERHHRARIRMEQMRAGGTAVVMDGAGAGPDMGAGRSGGGDH
ncbi:TolC family protein [Marinicauda salina]|nr:TolC family protein [Marinicauda salina]